MENDEKLWAEEGTAGNVRRRLDQSGSYSTTPPTSLHTDDDHVPGLGEGSSMMGNEPTSPIWTSTPINTSGGIEASAPMTQERPIGNKVAKRKGKSGLTDKAYALYHIDEGKSLKADAMCRVSEKIERYMLKIDELESMDISEFTESQQEAHATKLSVW